MAKQFVDVNLPIELSEVAEVVYQDITDPANNRSLFNSGTTDGLFAQAIVQGGQFNNGPGRDRLTDFVGYAATPINLVIGDILTFQDLVNVSTRYNVAAKNDTQIFAQGVTGTYEIAHTATKLWLNAPSSVNTLMEYDITLAPFTIVYNRTLNLQYKYGLFAKDNTTLFCADSIYAYEVDISTGTPTFTTKYTEPIAGRFPQACHYTTSGKLMISTHTTSANRDSKILQFNYSNMALELTITPVGLPTTYDITSIFTYNGVLYVSDYDKDVYSVLTYPPYTATLYDNNSNYKTMFSQAAASSTVIFSALAIPTVPTGLSSSSITQTTFTLQWLASSGTITGYKIYKNGVLYATNNSGSTNWAVTGQTAGATNTWTVSAYNGAGESAQSTGLVVTQTAAATWTSFLMVGTGWSTGAGACADTGFASTYYHDGSGAEPAVGDIISASPTGSPVFNGGNLWYRADLQATTSIKIGTGGTYDFGALCL